MFANSVLAKPNDIVDIKDIDPSIIVELRYIGDDNFIGRAITGYNENRALLTRDAAHALKKVQARVMQDGYSLVIYDAYRPQRASNDFKAWSQDAKDDRMQTWFYPRINKKQLFELDYIAQHSSHSRASTVDVTLIPLGQKPTAIKPSKRQLSDGFDMWFLDDGTVDMGSSFDLFDKASHYENALISKNHKAIRNYLRTTMEEAGFTYYPEEWWHFTLKNEPYPDTYFDF